MTREEKCLLAIERGFIYNQETGDITGPTGTIHKTKNRNDEKGYIKFRVFLNGKYYNLLGHQFAWYWVNRECVECLDHINGDRVDNRIINLRSVTKQENIFNMKEVKGYSWNKARGMWMSSICHNDKRIYLGYFDKEEDARAAYLEAKEKYHKINS